eukprot:1831803-Lingulodinium_polyedra.AAC.1
MGRCQVGRSTDLGFWCGRLARVRRGSPRQTATVAIIARSAFVNGCVLLQPQSVAVRAKNHAVAEDLSN